MNKYIYLIAPIAGWVVSQLLKLSLEEVSHRRPRLSDVLSSGSMPSSHMAGPAALLTVLGIHQGLTSPLFGLGFVYAVLVAYDSFGVRRMAAESAIAVKAISRKLGTKESPAHLYQGHSVPEVGGGILVGFVVGLIINWLF